MREKDGGMWVVVVVVVRAKAGLGREVGNLDVFRGKTSFPFRLLGNGRNPVYCVHLITASDYLILSFICHTWTRSRTQKAGRGRHVRPTPLRLFFFICPFVDGVLRPALPLQRDTQDGKKKKRETGLPGRLEWLFMGR